MSGNENGRPVGTVGAIAAIGQALIAALPGPFLGLLVINAAFLLAMFWFLHAQSASRERVISALVTACLNDHRGGVIRP